MPPEPTGWPPAPRLPTAPGSPSAPTEGPPRKLGPLLVGTAVAIAVVAAAVWWFTRDRIALPESFDGVTRYASPQTEAGLKQFRSSIDTQGFEGDMAFYAVGGTPRSALIWIRDPTTTNAEAAFRAFASGFGPALGGGAVGTDQLDGTAVAGITYLCAPVSGSIPGGVCLWKDGEIFWILFDAGQGAGVDATRDLAVQARAAVS